MSPNYQETVRVLQPVTAVPKHVPNVPKIPPIYNSSNGAVCRQDNLVSGGRHEPAICPAPSRKETEIRGSGSFAEPDPGQSSTVPYAVQSRRDHLNGTMDRRTVRWSGFPPPRSRSRPPKGSILRSTPSVARKTSPFSVTFEIAAEVFTVRFFSEPANIATLENFETALEKATPAEFKQRLRQKLKSGYGLQFRRLLRTATAIIIDEDSALRQAAFNRFLNSVFNDAAVTLIW
jgi:hypothetical protein